MSARVDSSAPPLDHAEAKAAAGVLVHSDLVQWRQVARQFSDPPIPHQNVFLFTFVPAKGATPDDRGTYGFFKMRGAYASEVDAESAAYSLIRNVDSLHEIVLGRVGAPYPLVGDLSNVRESKEVEFQELMEDNLVQTVRSAKEDILDAAKRYDESVQRARAVQSKEYDNLQGSKQPALIEENKEVSTHQFAHNVLSRARVVCHVRQMLLSARDMMEKMIPQSNSVDAAAAQEPELEKEFQTQYIQRCKSEGLAVNEASFDDPTHFLYYTKPERFHALARSITSAMEAMKGT